MSTVKLFIEADVAKPVKDLVEMITNAAKNSISHVLDSQLPSDDMLQLTIKTTADKIEGLCMRLGEAGLLLRDNASDILINASNQYSLYREIHLSLNIYSL